ncbi:phage portal protein [Bacillus sp. FJAT-45350]|uniref:phage portal protein n=1 Tax=Bacillus sp. FJAT-45350 TaxID=2011014 RepID=UPI000BB80D16|nr:phage portal protein [Bacillus sp. FJAT-45350]
MAKWYKTFVGEMSKLRNRVTNLLGWNIVGTWSNPYSLDSSKVDYKLARSLYDNTNDEYKLGAGFVKPVVNTATSFIGVPTFRSKDELVEEELQSFVERNRSRMLRSERNALRDGDCYVWLTRERAADRTLYPEDQERIVYNILPPDMVKDIVLDPITGDPTEYILQSEHEWEDERENKKRYTLTQKIRAGLRKVEAEGEYPEDLQLGEIITPWDFIPIVHFKNESDEHEKFGKSEMESIEPFLKAYHDVMHHAITGSKMHSTPKMKLKVKDVRAFLLNNFGVNDPVKFAKEGGAINLEGRELIFVGSEEDVEFIEVRSATGDAKLLLQLLFYCIVDTSETPEFAFGVHTPSSFSSVKEQMPILVRKVQRKREQFAEPWQRMARIVLAMKSHGENMRFSTYATELEWDEVDPRDSKELADEIETVVRALVQGLNAGLISIEAAVDFLSQYIDTMGSYEENEDGNGSEKDKLMKTKLMLMRLEDSQFLEEQKNKIDELLSR